jgi:uncharacterized RDD family membrane protein YckC
MRLGTKSKTTPSGLPSAGWWRRVVATLVDDTLTIVVVWVSALICATVIGKVVLTAVTKTIEDVRVKLGDVVDGAQFTAGNIQQQIHDLIAAWRASGKTPNDLVNLLVKDYYHNLHLSFVQALILLVCVAGSIYFVIYNHVIRISRKGRSFGDEIVGIYTVTETAKFPSYKAALIRYFVLGVLVALVSVVGTVFSSLANLTNTIAAVVIYVDVLYPLFDKHARALHDVIAKTYPAHPDRFGYALEHMAPSAVSE